MVELKLKKPTINQNIFLFYFIIIIIILYITYFIIIIFLTKQMHLPGWNWVLTAATLYLDLTR